MKNSGGMSAGRVWALFKQLDQLERMKLIAKFEKETREERWDRLLGKLSNRFRKNPVSDEEITRIVEEVRQERYDRSRKNRS